MRFVTAEYIEEGGYNKVIVFARDGRLKRRVTVYPFVPYFYTKASYKLPKKTILKVESGFHSLDGSYECLKLIFRNTRELKSYKEYLKSRGYASFEVLPLTERFLFDYKIKSKFDVNGSIIPNAGSDGELRIGVFDIEALQENKGMIDIVGDSPIIAVSIWDSYTDKVYVFYWDWNEDNVDYQIKSFELLDKTYDVEVVKCKDERELLLKFFGLIESLDFDILSGYNIVRYDFPKLISRATQLNIDYNVISPFNSVKVKEHDVNIMGREIFDVFFGVLVFEYKETFKEYGLDYVATKLLGVGKSEIEIPFEDTERVLRYNIQDVLITKELMKQYLEVILAIQEIVGVRLKDIFNYKDFRLRNVLLAKLLMMSFLDSKTVLTLEDKENESSYEGAIVLEPVGGIHTNVAVLDIASMYPNIIRVFNLSPETIDIRPLDVRLTEKLWVSRKRRGVLAKVSEYLLDTRAKLKERMKETEDENEYHKLDIMQWAFKILANMLYGVMKFFDIDLATVVTALGRRIISFVREKVEELNYLVVLGDTDSVGISVDNEEDIPKVIEYLNSKASELSKEYGINEPAYRIKQDDFFVRLLAISGRKKRYAGIRKDGSLLIKGFDCIRSSTSDFVSNVQYNLIKMILEGKDRMEIKQYIESEIKAVKKGKYSIFELAIPVRITKPFDEYKVRAIHIRATEYSNDYLGTNFGVGSKPRWVYVRSVPEGFFKTDAIALVRGMKIPEGFKPDYDKIIYNTLKNKIEPLMQLVGLRWENLFYETIEDFFLWE